MTPISCVIFDVDGVLLDSPHEEAWREALAGFADPALLTTELYQSEIAGRPRLDGAVRVLSALGVPNPGALAGRLADAKQAILAEMIAQRRFTVFADGVMFLAALRGMGLQLAAASSSKNANTMLGMIGMPQGGSMREAFDSNLCGASIAHGKPAPDIFLAAASALGAEPSRCLVVEDAPAGITAGRAGGMRTLGIARHHDGALLRGAGAEIVVTNLSDVATGALANGRLEIAA